ncbi:MAG: hypothetical protein AB7S38_32160 [Vulcanimicrobiota bacterium]
MQESCVLFYGTLQHPGLAILYETLLNRQRRPVAFFTQEQFFSECSLYLGPDPGTSLVYLPDGGVLPFSTVSAVCMDHFFVPPESLEGFSEQDRGYIQLEEWATLIAMFDQLSDTALMANFFRRPDTWGTRWSTMRTVSAAGLPVPEMLVTSDPEAARDFHRHHQGRIIYRQVGDPGSHFTAMEEDQLELLERLPLAPIHFEAEPWPGAGALCVVGEEGLFVGEAEPPAQLQEACLDLARSLELNLGEFNLRRGHDGQWQVGSLQSFPSLAALSHETVRSAVAELLEGKP